jgi:Tol biopolymer transport system component
MNKRFHLLLVSLTLLATAFACTLPFAAPQPSGDQVATVVAATLQALTASPSTGEAPAPTPVGLLPHALYFLHKDGKGFEQVYRLETDGQTVNQITFEPVAVSSYDVSPVDGRVAYVANNQLLLIDAAGAGRRVLVDGGPLDENNPFVSSVNDPAFSPDGGTIAYWHKGLNLHTVSTGVTRLVLEKQRTDPVSGAPVPAELYLPQKYSPDGSKLLITIAIPNSDGIFAGIYYPDSGSLVRLTGGEGAGLCCGEQAWSPDGSALFNANAILGFFSTGLWRVDAASGNVTTLIPSEAGGGNYNLAAEPYLASDGQLYFFFGTAPAPDGFIDRGPVQMVRSAPDGVTGRTVLRPETFERLNEALWAPDASFVILAKAPTATVYAGGVIELYYTDGGKSMIPLLAFGQRLKWGP